MNLATLHDGEGTREAHTHVESKHCIFLVLQHKSLQVVSAGFQVALCSFTVSLAAPSSRNFQKALWLAQDCESLQHCNLSTTFILFFGRLSFVVAWTINRLLASSAKVKE